MHRVRCGTVVAEDDTDGGVLAEVVDVPLRVVRVGGVAGVSEVEEGKTAVVLERVLQSAEKGSLVIRSEARVVHVPSPDL